MTDTPGAADDVGDELEELYECLEATERLPIDRTANRWLGEAQAITADLVQGDPDDGTVGRRVEKVLGLLEEIDGTGSDEGDELVASAREAARAILESD